jgi:hypothetical protein
MPDLSIDVEVGPVRASAVSSALGLNVAIAGGVILKGWSLRETTGAALASAEFSSGSQVVGESGMPSGLADTKVMPGNGTLCASGISITASVGAWTGCLYYQNPLPGEGL